MEGQKLSTKNRAHRRSSGSNNCYNGKVPAWNNTHNSQGKEFSQKLILPSIFMLKEYISSLNMKASRIRTQPNDFRIIFYIFKLARFLLFVTTLVQLMLLIKNCLRRDSIPKTGNRTIQTFHNVSWRKHIQISCPNKYKCKIWIHFRRICIVNKSDGTR